MHKNRIKCIKFGEKQKTFVYNCIYLLIFINNCDKINE